MPLLAASETNLLPGGATTVSMLGNIREALSLGGGGSGNDAWPGRNLGPGAMVSDFERVTNYHRYTNIYYGRFNRAFSSDPTFSGVTSASRKANLASRNVDALVSAVWPGVPTPEAEDERMTFFAHELLENVKAQEAIGANVLDVALYGDGVFRVDVEASKLRVRTINPTAYFPELLADRPQEPVAHNIIYPEDATCTWYRRERFFWVAATKTWWLSVDRFHKHSGQTGPVTAPVDLKLTCCPIIHTYAKRLSGIYYGKPALADCEGMVAQYAATFIKLDAISDMASTKALLAAPYNAFDDKGRLVWDTAKPYMVDDADMATFDKAKFGWIEPPGMALVEPLLETLTATKHEVTEAFGLTSAIFGDTGNVRDIGAPGLERVNLLMEFTVGRYQERFGSFLSDLVNVARDYAVVHLGADLPTAYEAVNFTWPEFAPETEGEKADTAAKKIAVGLPKAKALAEMGYENAEALVAQANAETAGQFAFPHSPFDPNSPEPEVDAGTDALFE